MKSSSDKANVLKTERHRLHNIQHDIYNITNQYEYEHIINLASELLLSLKPYLGLFFVNEPEDGTLLHHVRTGYAAYEAGLRNNDIVLAINNIPTPSKTTLSCFIGIKPAETF